MLRSLLNRPNNYFCRISRQTAARIGIKQCASTISHVCVYARIISNIVYFHDNYGN